MEDAESWISEIGDGDLAEAVTFMTSKLYNLIEYKRTKNDKVTGPLCMTVKKALDFINMKILQTYKRNIQLETQFTEAKNYREAIDELAQRIARQSTGSVDIAPVSVPLTEVGKQKQDFPVIITASDVNEDMEVLRKRVKDAFRSDASLPAPRDVVVTKAKQVILKMTNRDETEKMREKLMEMDSLRSDVKVNIPRRRRERLLLLSVDPEVEEKTVGMALRKILDDSAPDGTMVRSLAIKLRTQTLTQDAKDVLQDIYQESTIDFEIVRAIKTRTGRVNWLIDIDNAGKNILLNMKKICIEFERYRLVEFVPIIRCYKCQAFDHYASNCKGKLTCAACSGPHNVKDCKSTDLCCSNCYFQDSEGDTGHRADSPDCPVYKSIRQKSIPNRS